MDVEEMVQKTKQQKNLDEIQLRLKVPFKNLFRE
jgi:hypothetical protein